MCKVTIIIKTRMKYKILENSVSMTIFNFQFSLGYNLIQVRGAGHLHVVEDSKGKLLVFTIRDH